MAGRITIVGLGPGDYQRIPSETSRVLLDPDAEVMAAAESSGSLALSVLAWAHRDLADGGFIVEAGMFDLVVIQVQVWSKEEAAHPLDSPDIQSNLVGRLHDVL